MNPETYNALAPYLYATGLSWLSVFVAVAIGRWPSRAWVGVLVGGVCGIVLQIIIYKILMSFMFPELG